MLRGVSDGAKWIDSLLNNAEEVGMPATMVDFVRDNPIYSTIMSAADFTGDVDKDLRRGAGFIDRMVEGEIIPRAGMLNARMNTIGAGNQVWGSQPVRSPTSRGFIGQGMAVG
jgi:hypothetical protein